MIKWLLVIILVANIVSGFVGGFDWLGSTAIVAIIIALGMELYRHDRH